MKTHLYKKYHKKKTIYYQEKNSLCSVKRGFYGLKAVNSGIITPKQLETVRRIISRLTKRTTKIILNVNFSQPLTKKSLLSRMGKGSGNVYL
jgi:large subunit ribosomal protein L16